MNLAILYLVYAAIAIVFTVSAQQGRTCQACSCQFNNVEVLDQLIESKIITAGFSGVTYVRWGGTSCPNDTDAQLVYSGRAGGTNWNAPGGSAERICLPDNPDYITESIDLSSHRHKSVVQGVEYEVNYNALGDPIGPLAHLHEQNAPCAVCDIPTRSRAIMIPAKTTCPLTWTREYYGYLMADYDARHRSVYTCLDIDSEAVAGEGHDTNPSLFYHTVTDCNGLLCPPYENDRMLSCVVCTK